MRIPITILLAGYSMTALAISNNNSLVTNSMTALSATVCTGQTKIGTCGKLRGTVDVVAGAGTPSLYSIDELAFVRDSGTVAGITPAFFPSNGVPSLGSGAINSTSLACYVLDANPGAAGILNYHCEMSSLACNTVYRYHFAGSHTTAGAVEHSNTNTTATSISFYTTPCAPGAGSMTGSTNVSATVSVSISKGALAQTITAEYGPTTGYGSTATMTGGSVTSGSGSSTVTATLTGLTCNNTYHIRFNSTTNDSAVNGSTLVNGADATITPTCSNPLPPPPPTITTGGGSTTINAGGVVRIVDNTESGTILTLTGSGSTVLEFGVNNTVVVQTTGQTGLIIGRTSDGRVSFRIENGSLTITGNNAGQPIFMTAGGLQILAGQPGTTVEVAYVNGKLRTLSVRKGQVVLPTNLFAAQSSSLAGGETAEFDSSERIIAQYLGTLSGTSSALGDFLPLSGVSNIPRLGGVPERLAALGQAQRLDEKLSAVLTPFGLASSTQDEFGVLRIRSAGELGTRLLAPLGRIALVEGENDGVTINPDGTIRVVIGGYVISLVPTVADPAGLVAALSRRFPGAVLKLSNDGAWMIAEQNGQRSVVRPGWETSFLAAGTTGLGSDSEGRLYYAHDGFFGSILYPALADFATVLSAARRLDPNASLTNIPGRDPVLVISGRTYTLRPDTVLTSRDGTHASDAYWLSGGKLYIPVSDQTAQGFTIR